MTHGTDGPAAAKSLQLCPTLCDPIYSSPLSSATPGILQARTLEWVAISFSNAWKWSHLVVSDPQRPHGLQPTRLLCPWEFPGKSTGVGCHCLLRSRTQMTTILKSSYKKLQFQFLLFCTFTFLPQEQNSVRKSVKLVVRISLFKINLFFIEVKWSESHSVVFLLKDNCFTEFWCFLSKWSRSVMSDSLRSHGL